MAPVLGDVAHNRNFERLWPRVPRIEVIPSPGQVGARSGQTKHPVQIKVCCRGTIPQVQYSRSPKSPSTNKDKHQRVDEDDSCLRPIRKLPTFLLQQKLPDKSASFILPAAEIAHTPAINMMHLPGIPYK
ncbi:uncharacterized protein CLUP02_09579 [Colletotrichum lupini]|uniref:Uncharacterized protein n=1 Tax=Colletotrichum lupini TaxID=145971 RepID=A0A9Q8WHQ7_9PEZI|nr:uncharacterized protein CLUP02_09579 [Colletotrichum lupini]UQC84083.1 hypothetical protein CLUP02_09579 [Colletotrichum lupini]